MALACTTASLWPFLPDHRDQLSRVVKVQTCQQIRSLATRPAERFVLLIQIAMHDVHMTILYESSRSGPANNNVRFNLL
jgi:hypothetical protein